MSWLQQQVMVKLNKQDVIERQAFDHLVRDVVRSIENYETEINKCGNKPSKQQFQRLRSKNIEAIGSMNCLGLSMDDFKNDKKALKMAINRIIPYYLKIRKSNNKILEAKILPLILYLVNAFKNNEYKMLPPPKLNNFNQFLANSALKNYGYAQQEIKKEMEEITNNYVKYHKNQENMMSNNTTRNNLQIFNNIQYNNKDLKTSNLYGSVNNNEINYNIEKDIEEDDKRLMENEIFNHNENDFDFNTKKDDIEMKNNDTNSDKRINTNTINGISKDSFFTINEIKNLKKGDFIDYKDNYYQYHRAQIDGIVPNNGFRITYLNTNNKPEKYIPEQILFNESNEKMAKQGSFTNLKATRFNDLKMNTVLVIRGDYFDENPEEWFPIKACDINGGQIKFGVKIRGMLYQKWIHLNDTRLEKNKGKNNNSNNNNHSKNNHNNPGWQINNVNNNNFYT